MRLRTNHTTQRNSVSLVIRVGIFLICLILLFAITRSLTNRFVKQSSSDQALYSLHGDEGERYFLPSSKTGKIVHYKEFSLSYCPDHKQAEWVAYILSADNLRLPLFEIEETFHEDIHLEGKSARPKDYAGSGFARGHLVPAEDMAFDQDALSQSFLMSNISPQTPGFNRGVWRELESQTRKWAYERNSLIVISGPVLSSGLSQSIAKSGITVPELFFKILLDPISKETVAFLIPNSLSVDPLQDYVVSVSYLEDLTGIDFFHELFQKDYQSELEETVDIRNWRFDEELFRLRLESWNLSLVE